VSAIHRVSAQLETGCKRSQTNC